MCLYLVVSPYCIGLTKNLCFELRWNTVLQLSGQSCTVHNNILLVVRSNN